MYPRFCGLRTYDRSRVGLCAGHRAQIITVLSAAHSSTGAEILTQHMLLTDEEAMRCAGSEGG